MPKKNKKEFRHLWTVFCKDTVVDQNTNLLSLMNVVENIMIDPMHDINNNIENIGLNLKMVTRFTFDKKIKKRSIEYKIVLELPNGRKIDSPEVNKIEIPAGKDNLRIIDELKAVPFGGFGEYVFKFKIKEGKSFVDSYEAPIKLVKAQEN